MVKDKYFVVDAHCHIYPDKIALKAAEGTGNFYGITMKHSGTVSEMLKNGEAAGIDRYLVHSVATTPHQVGSINSFIAEQVRLSGGIFTGFGSLHPDSEDIEGDFMHLLELGLKGVKLHPDIQRFRINGRRSGIICSLCEEHNIPMLLHTGDSRYTYSNPDNLIPVLKEHKRLTVIGAHFGGWSMWRSAVKDLAGFENLYVDCSSSLYALTPPEAREVIYAYGSDRVLFGTDYPMWNASEELERFFGLELSDDDNKKILSQNAMGLLGIN